MPILTTIKTRYPFRVRIVGVVHWDCPNCALPGRFRLTPGVYRVACRNPRCSFWFIPGAIGCLAPKRKRHKAESILPLDLGVIRRPRWDSPVNYVLASDEPLQG